MNALITAQCSSRAATESSRRLCIFAHYDPEGTVDEYVLRMLRALREHCLTLVFVSTSPGLARDVAVGADLVVVRENEGFDFCSWKAGLAAVPDWNAFDEIVLCNDSVYGPLSPMQDAFAAMAARPCDFWGMTDNREIDYHVQSYFLVFRHAVVASSTFREFWESVRPLGRKRDVVVEHEVALSRRLIEAGFHPDTLFHDDVATRCHAIVLAAVRCIRAFIENPRSLRRPNWVWHAKYRFNKTRFFWRHLIRRRMPFVKVELFRLNPMGVDERTIYCELARTTDYPLELIRGHLARTRSYYAREAERELARRSRTPRRITPA